MSIKILIVEDDYITAKQYESWLGMLDENFEIHHVSTISKARAFIMKNLVDIVILDVKLPDGNGLDLLLEKLLNAYVLVLTSYPDYTDAKFAIWKGAVNYIAKESLTPESFLQEIRKLVKIVKHEKKQQMEETEYEDIEHKIFEQFITYDYELRKNILWALNFLKLSVEALDSDENYFPLLITGETGVGKTFLAELFYRHLNLKGRFIRLNMPNFSRPETFENEFFGRQKGAYTDAKTDQPGVIESAQNGLLLLDEIGDIDDVIQSKLLMLVETKTFRRMGEAGEGRKLKALIVATTNRDIDNLLKTGKLRKDFFYRFKHLEIPPLRERKKDILPIAEKFLSEKMKKNGKEGLQFSISAKYAMLNYDWPGNVRELFNIVSTAIEKMSKGKVFIEDSDLFPESEPPFSPEKPEESVKKQELIKALIATGCNKSKTAERLGVSRPTVYNWIKKWGIDLKDICPEKAKSVYRGRKV